MEFQSGIIAVPQLSKQPTDPIESILFNKTSLPNALSRLASYKSVASEQLNEEGSLNRVLSKRASVQRTVPEELSKEGSLKKVPSKRASINTPASEELTRESSIKKVPSKRVSLQNIISSEDCVMNTVDDIAVDRDGGMATSEDISNTQKSMDVDELCQADPVTVNNDIEAVPQADVVAAEPSIDSSAVNDQIVNSSESIAVNGDVSGDSSDVNQSSEESNDEQAEQNNEAEAMVTEDEEPSENAEADTTTDGPSAGPSSAIPVPGYNPFGPPPIEIIITFDTTGSMSYYLDEIKNQINDVINRLFMDIPSLKIGLIAHGDYCDENVFYLTRQMELTNDINSLCEMVRNVEGTGGGDFAECYEMILRQVRLVKWSPGSQRALIMIGDACPHTIEELAAMGKEQIDWKVEAAALKYEMGVRVYGVQCQNQPEAGTFWDDLAAVTAGQHLMLDKFSAIVDIIMAICYREGGEHYLQAYEQEVRAREGRMLATEIDHAFGVLRTGEPSTSGTAASPKPITITAAKKKKAKVVVKKPRVIKASAAVKASKKKDMVAECSSTKKAMMGRVSVTAAAKKAQTTVTAKRKRKQFRETVSEARFAANHLPWSPWVKVISHGGDGHKIVNNINKLEETHNTRRVTIYEVAVQLKPRCKRYTVHFHVKDVKDSMKDSWFNVVFTRRIKKKIDSVFAQNDTSKACVFVRRLALHGNSRIDGKKVGNNAVLCKQTMSRLYDYAWRKYSKQTPRKVVRNGVHLQ